MIFEWNALFSKVKDKEYSKTLHDFLEEEYCEATIYPPRDMIYQAFKLTSPKKLKVVIIGQDPYHNPAQAMGLAFSVPRGVDVPPSLRNVYKEIESDLEIEMDFDDGDLTPWAEQGVLLLNAYLTVRSGKPLSHAREEYILFLKDALKYIDSLNQPVVFMLWGSFAKKFAPFITNKNRLILESNHPSPLSANRGGWFDKHQFSQCNDFLIGNNVPPIDWKI